MLLAAMCDAASAKPAMPGQPEAVARHLPDTSSRDRRLMRRHVEQVAKAAAATAASKASTATEPPAKAMPQAGAPAKTPRASVLPCKKAPVAGAPAPKLADAGVGGPSRPPAVFPPAPPKAPAAVVRAEVPKAPAPLSQAQFANFQKSRCHAVDQKQCHYYLPECHFHLHSGAHGGRHRSVRGDGAGNFVAAEATLVVDACLLLIPVCSCRSYMF